MMDNWKFLIQREGDRDWRTVRSSRLQLPEGRYRIIAMTELKHTQVQIRVTHQPDTPDARLRKAAARSQNTSGEGSILVMPMTALQKGIWQFVCSGEPAGDGDTIPWQEMLKLKVIPADNDALADGTSDIQQLSTRELPSPRPPVPITEWIRSPETDREKATTKLEIRQIQAAPARAIHLDRDTFSGVAGARLCVSGACNLNAIDPQILRPIQLSKLTIYLRYERTGAPFMSIEQAIPAATPVFSFSGQFDLPNDLDTDCIVGEVSLYDRHNIQLAVNPFQIDLIDPIEPSFLDELPQFNSLGYENPERILARIDRDVEHSIAPTLETATDTAVSLPDIAIVAPEPVDPAPQYPTIPPSYAFSPQPRAIDRHPDECEDELSLDLAATDDRSLHKYNSRESLEIVVDDE